MPLYNVKKKMTKAADRLGLAADEAVVAACMTFPAGHKRKTAIHMAAGGVTTMGAGQVSADGEAARMPNGQHFLAVTNRRLLATTVKAVSTNPDEIVAEWAIELVRSIDVEKAKMASAVRVQFFDGSVMLLDGAHSSGASDFDGVLD